MSVSIDAIFSYDVYSLSQDLVIRKQLAPPSAFATTLANPNAPDLRLAVITVFPGITQQPTLVPTSVNLDDPTSAGTEPDTDIIFSGARMIAGHAFLTGDNPTPIPVVKSLAKYRSKLVLGRICPTFSNSKRLKPATARDGLGEPFE